MVGAPAVLPENLASQGLLIWFPAFLLVTGVVWYTALSNAHGRSITDPFAFLAALAMCAVSFFAAYASTLALIPAIVGVVMGVGTIRGLSLVRALAVVPLITALVVGLIRQPPII